MSSCSFPVRAVSDFFMLVQPTRDASTVTKANDSARRPREPPRRSRIGEGMEMIPLGNGDRRSARRIDSGWPEKAGIDTAERLRDRERSGRKGEARGLPRTNRSDQARPALIFRAGRGRDSRSKTRLGHESLERERHGSVPRRVVKPLPVNSRSRRSLSPLRPPTTSRRGPGTSH